MLLPPALHYDELSLLTERPRCVVLAGASHDGEYLVIAWPFLHTDILEFQDALVHIRRYHAILDDHPRLRRVLYRRLQRFVPITLAHRTPAAQRADVLRTEALLAQCLHEL